MAIQWNYVSPTKKSTGYEDVMDKLAQYTQERYLKTTPEEQERMVDEVFQIYRSKNIFPIWYFNEEGAKEEIKKCIEKDIKWEGNVLNLRYTQGSALCKWLMPNMFDVVVRDNEATQYKRFYDDEELKKAIRFCLRYDTGVKPHQVQAGLRMTSSVATNFPPMRAKAIYERFVEPGGVIYDFAHGFGGRILGALSSKNNYRYIGVDPCRETFANVRKLGRLIESVTGREDSWQTYCVGSEDFYYGDETIDFAFSSPPYFTLERYSDEETQCYNRFPTLEEWLEGYVRATIRNIYGMLKPNRYYAVNIADFSIGSKKVEYVDEWIRISQEEGFKFDHVIYMKLQTRTGNRGINDDKKEGIYVFKKEC